MMNKTLELIEVAISCPSDMSEEKHKAIDAIDEINRIFEIQKGPHVRVKDWEKNSVGHVTNDTQAALNEQIFDECDLFLALIGDRIGSPTPRSVSGTAEEVENALKVQNKYSPNHLQVLFREKTNVDISKIDIYQLSKRQSFRKDLQEKALTADFRNLQELSEQVKNWIVTAVSGKNSVPEKKTNTLKIVEDVFDHRRKLNESNTFDDDDEYLDLIDKSNKYLESAGDCIKSIGESITEMGNFVNELPIEINKATESSDVSKLKSLIDEFGDRMKLDSNNLAKYNIELKTHLTLGLDAFDSVLLHEDFHQIENKSIQNDLIEVLKETMDGISGFKISVEEAIENLRNLPRATSRFNKGRRCYLSFMTDLAKVLNDADRSFKDQINLLA